MRSQPGLLQDWTDVREPFVTQVARLMVVSSETEQRPGASEMPHLHLPTHHTDADLILAANLADVVGSEDLYVAWTHESGAGAVPEVDAVLVEARRAGGLAEIVAHVGSGFAAFLRALVGRQGESEVTRAPSAGATRRGAGEPSV
jgi:hypothetical protein